MTAARLAYTALALLAVCALRAEIPERDSRNTEIRHTDLHYDFGEYTASQWRERARLLRKQILFSSGLLPRPAKTDLNARTGPTMIRDGYSVNSVLLETYPGYCLGGNLYRPIEKDGPFPAVASPHGHWQFGRFENSEFNSVPARAINLARQGYVVFAYDMVGWNDTVQTPHDFGGPREKLWLIGPLGLQLWNSIRVVDYLSSLPGVDSSRIGATGASGGATQVFLLAAVDDRVSYSAPVNMVSFHMQGGSPCENAPLLRIGTNNVEIAAAFAPKPQLLVSATGDWTANVPTKEFPAVQEIYRLLGAPADVEWRQFDSPHNYHQGSREAVYAFFGKHMLGVEDEPWLSEGGAKPEQLSSLLYLWGREPPAGAVTFEGLVRQRIAASEADTLALAPLDAKSLGRAQEAFGERLRLAILPDLPSRGGIEARRSGTADLLLGRKDAQDRIPASIANEGSGLGRPTLVVHSDGKSAARESDVGRELARRGSALLFLDAFQTGDAAVERDIAGAGRMAERYYHVFNRSDDANRVQDILTGLAFLREHTGSAEVNLVGLGRAGLWSLLAAAIDGAVHSVAADLDGFDASDDSRYVDGLYIPGLRRAGDFRAAAPLLTDSRLLLHNAHDGFPQQWYRDAFRAAGRPAALQINSEPTEAGTLAEWLAD